MHKFSAAIIGASGYSGIEATRILAAHPHLELTRVTSDRWSGSSVGERLGRTGAISALRYEPLEKSVEVCEGVDVVFLATPAEVSLDLLPRLAAADEAREKARLVVDLSGAFRLAEPRAYEHWYGFSHRAPELLASAVYGLPELFRSSLKKARRVANPGCYATAAALAVAPLLEGGLLDEAEGVVFDAASGTTGAGRKASEDLSFSEVDEDYRAYRVLRHQHTPEIAQTLSRVAGREVRLTFTTHLLPIKRGILVTAYARLKEGRSPTELRAAFERAYGNEPFVRIVDDVNRVSLKQVVGTNACALAVCCEEEGAVGFDPRRVIVVAAIDNLVKGAAGQAVQNANLALGLEETLGLDTLRGFYP